MPNRSEQPNEDKRLAQVMKSLPIMTYITLTATIAAYAIWFVIFNRHTLSAKTTDWASFGDFFGGTVGPFVGFASVMLIVETIKLQQRGLKEQQEQLQKSSDEANKQNRILMLQSFEQSFFGWLRDYKQQLSGFRFPKEPAVRSLKSISSIPEEDIRTGPAAISSMAKYFFNNATESTHSGSKKQAITNKLIEAWDQVYVHNGEALRTSLRTLFGLLRWIDEHATLEPGEKRHYARILRAQLSDHELILIYINGLTRNGKPMNDRVNRYALFDNFEISLYPVMANIYDEEDPKPYLQSAFNSDKAQELHWKNC